MGLWRPIIEAAAFLRSLVEGKVTKKCAHMHVVRQTARCCHASFGVVEIVSCLVAVMSVKWWSSRWLVV